MKILVEKAPKTHDDCPYKKEIIGKYCCTWAGLEHSCPVYEQMDTSYIANSFEMIFKRGVCPYFVEYDNTDIYDDPRWG